jgi:hypothetical protein
MSAVVIAAVVFACVFGGALFGMFLGAVLPKHHLSSDARDVIKVAMAMIATLCSPGAWFTDCFGQEFTR